jgi:Na+/H+-dicarboxylate symporter
VTGDFLCKNSCNHILSGKRKSPCRLRGCPPFAKEGNTLNRNLSFKKGVIYMWLINWTSLGALSFTLLLFVGLAYLRKRKLDFGLLVLTGLASGITVGLIFKNNLDFIAPFGTVYVRIITAVVAPLVIVSIIAGVTSIGNLQKLKSIGAKSIFWLLLNTFIAILLSLGTGLIFGVGKNAGVILSGIDPEQISAVNDRVTPFTDVIINFFPSNIVKDIESNSIIPIILFSLIIAVSYALYAHYAGEEKVLPFKAFTDAAKNVIYQAVDIIVEFTPYAVLALTAAAVGRASAAGPAILPLLTLLLIVYGVCAAHTYIINGALVWSAAGLNPLKFFKKLGGAQAAAFTSQSSVGTLPVTIRNLTKGVGVSDDIANFTAPLGTAIGMPGCSGIWPVLLAVFAVNALGINYSFTQYAALAAVSLAVSLGTAGVPGTATITSTTVFVTLGLPVEVIVLLLPISAIADMARTATNVTAAAVTSAIVAKRENQLDLNVFNDIVK